MNKFFGYPIIILMFNFIFLPDHTQATEIFVDQNLKNDCIGNTYSVLDRSCNGDAGPAYRSIQQAIDGMSTGDSIVLRGGIYRVNHIRLPESKNGTSWEKGSYNEIKSFEREWAVLDGNNSLTDKPENGQCVIGYDHYDKTGSADLKYWKFERLEIRNGSSKNGEYAYGFWGNGGPFWFRLCYIHDNLAATPGHNPSGLTGMVWNGCLVEYCVFENNGATGDRASHHNSAHINIHSDYIPDDIARYGISDRGFIDNGHHIQKNVYRYNLFLGGTAVAIKYKNDQHFTGRNPAAENGYVDTFKDYGDNIHHNIFLNTNSYAIDARQDFIQIHHNIIDSCSAGIIVGEPDTGTIYKAVVYNNTVISPETYGIQWFHYNDYDFQPPELYAYAYNNILDGCQDGWNHSDLSAWHPADWESAVFDHIVFTNNLFYRPEKNSRDEAGDLLVFVDWERHTKKDFESRYPGSQLYLKHFSEKQPLYIGISGADRYRVRESFMVEKNKSVTEAGSSGSHPYLNDKRIPSYIGAVSSDESEWVDCVLGLRAIENEIPVNMQTPKCVQ